MKLGTEIVWKRFQSQNKVRFLKDITGTETTRTKSRANAGVVMIIQLWTKATTYDPKK